MTKETPDLQAAETSLDNALASIKGGNPPEVEKEVVETKEEIKQEPQEEKRETLRLPEKQEKESKFVETDEPEVQRRINELYKESKTNKERATLLEDELMRIAQRAEEREQYLVTELQKIQNRTTQQDDESTLSSLRSEYNEAIQNLDYDKAAKINEKIVDFKTEQKINSILKEKAENNQRQQVRPVRKAPVYSDPQDEADATRLQAEKAPDGSLARPWLQPGHPQFQDVIDLMAAESNRIIRKNQRPSLSAVMQQVDKWMGYGNQKGSSQGQAPSLKHPPVLSSNTTLNASSDNQASKLNDLEKSYAAKLGVSEDKYARLRRLSSSGPISMDNFKK